MSQDKDITKSVTKVVTLVASGLATALIVWVLWNALMPGLFGFQVVSFVQALGLTALCSFLFKSSK